MSVDILCKFLADHEAREVGVGSRHGRHDGGVGDHYLLQPVELAPFVDHAQGVARITHFGGPTRVIATTAETLDQLSNGIGILAPGGIRKNDGVDHVA